MNIQERKERDRLRKQQDFFAAAEKLFALKGYDNTSVNDIAREAGYAAGTLYLYFANKDELLVSLLESKLTGFQGKIAVEIEGVTDPLEVFQKIIRCQVLGMIEYSKTFAVIFPILIQPRWWEEHDQEGRLQDIIDCKDTLIRNSMKALIEEGIVNNDLDLDFFILSLEGIIHELVLCKTVKQKLKMSPEDISRNVYLYAEKILGISDNK